MTKADWLQIIGYIVGLAWPAIVLVIYFGVRKPVLKILESRRITSLKFGGAEIGFDEATESLRKQVVELQGALEFPVAADRALRPSLAPAVSNKILWVDDYPDNNALQRQALIDRGFAVHIATTTTEALFKLPLTKYGLIISDMGRVENGQNNPQAGLELLETLKRGAFAIPLIFFCSTNAVMKYRDLALAAGAIGITTSTLELYKLIDSLGVKSANAN